MSAELDRFSEEEWEEFEKIRKSLPPLPPEVDGFIHCQILGSEDLDIVINAKA
jgi:hypothetical protein